ncbi:intermembrane lipid transfer protein VPS13A-like isoform X2 [Hydractinia symbiolongicarpus]|uniref:intermembrane lipid transfer protein VPS13A-like isoform X2 n=1 Tax=Hydractinia symbiolongicarpus TaxID=13093 RepID=UPI00254BB3AC|nr:intermembrane lipid transfer protein VPS13A-like isoform X2 [Hydractinia symbiolongicarpus]
MLMTHRTPSIQKQKIVKFSLQKLFSELTERPGSDGYGFKFEVESMGILGEVEKEEVDILKVKTDADNFLSCNVQSNPTNVTADYSVDLVVQSLHMFYNQAIANAVRKFFVVENNNKMIELEQNASSKLEEISSASRAGIEYSIMHNKSTYLHINLKSPVVVLPNHKDRDAEVLYIYLGDLTVTTDLQTILSELAIREATESDLESMFYHKTDVKLSNIHVGCATYEARTCELEHLSDGNYILVPTCIGLTVHRSLKSGYANFPDFKISGVLSSLEVKLSEQKVVQIVETMHYFFPPAAVPHVGTLSKSNSETSQSKHKKSGSVMSKHDLSNLQDVLNDSTKTKKEKLSGSLKDVSSTDFEENTLYPVQSYDSDLAMFDRTKMLAAFEITKIVVSYDTIIDSKPEKFLSLMVTNITCDIVMRMWHVDIKAKLKYFMFADCINTDSYGETTEFVHSIENKDLIKVDWTQANTSSPEFATTFNQIENLANIKFGNLRFYLKEKNLIMLVNCIQSLAYRISLLSDQQERTPIISKPLDIIPEDDDVDVESKKSLHKIEEAVTASTSLHLNFILNSIDIKMANSKQDIVEAQISDAQLLVIMHAQNTEISAQLKSLTVCDLSPDIDFNFKEILSVNADKLFKCKAIQSKDVLQDSLDPNLVVDFDLGKLKLNAVLPFLVNLMNLFYDINASLLTYQPITTEEPAVKKAITNEFFKLKLDVSIDAPDIVLPFSKSSNHCFVLDLGHCEIHSTPIMQDKIVCDQLKLDLEQLKLSTINGDHEKEVILPVTLEVTLRRSLNNVTPTFDVNCKLPMLMTRLHQQDIKDAVKLLQGIFEDMNALKKDTLANTTVVTTSTPEDEAVKQVTSVFVCIGQMGLQALSTTPNKKEYLFLDLMVESLNTKLKQNSTLLSVDVSLGALTLSDHSQEGVNDEPLTLFSSVDGKKLASISYSSDVLSNSQNITFELDKVNINADDESIASSVAYVTNILTSVNMLFNEKEEVKVVSTVPEPKNEEELLVEEEIKQETSELNIHCKLTSLTIFWLMQKREIAKSKVDGLTLLADLKGNNVGVKARLKNLYIEDMRQNVLYPKIIVLEDQDLLSLEFSLKEHSTSAMQESVTEQVAYIWLRVGRIKIVFLYKFIVEIMNCINPFLNLFNDGTKKNIQDTSEEHTVPKSDPKVLLLHLDIDITAPLVTFPKLSTSETYLLADLGKCIITNSIETEESSEMSGTDGDEKTKYSKTDHVKATLSSVKLMIMNLSNQKEKRITKELSMGLNIYRPLNPDMNDISVDVDVLPVIVLLSDTDIQLLMTIVQLNLGEAEVVLSVDKDKTVATTTTTTAITNAAAVAMTTKIDVHKDVNSENTSSAQLKAQVDQTDHGINEDTAVINDKSSTIHISIHCKLMELNLSSCLLFQDCETPESVNICQLSATSTTIEIVTKNDSLELDLNIFHLTGDDQRPFSKASFKRILEKCVEQDVCAVPVMSTSKSFVKKGAENNHVTLKYTSKSGEQIVALNIANARTFINLEFVKDLIKYLSNTFAGDASDQKNESHVEKSRQKEGDSHNEVEPKSNNTKLTVKCQLDNGEVILLQNPNKTNTPAIVGLVQLYVNYEAGQVSTKIDIPDCLLEMLYGEYPVLRSTARPLLQPCHITCKILMPDVETQDISLKVKEMKFKLSPSILTTIIKITDSLTGTQLLQEAEDASKKHTSSIDWTSHPLSNDKINTEASSVDTNLPSVPKDVVEKEKAVLSFSMIELILGNDLEGMFNPLLMTKISTKTNLVDWSGLMKIEADFTTEIHYFNDLFGTWEPLVEPNVNAASYQPYELNARMFYGESKQIDFSSNILEDQKDESSYDDVDEIDASVATSENNTKAFFLIVSSEDVLQLTVTQKAVEIINHVTQAWSIESLRENVKTELRLPFHFTSQLGIPVVVSMDPSIKASTTEESHLKIQPRRRSQEIEQTLRKTSLTATPGKQKLKKRNTSASSPSTTSLGVDVVDSSPWLVDESSRNHFIDVDINGFDTVRNISLKEAGNQVYTLFPTKDGNLLHLVVQVKVVTGSRIVTFGSTLQVKNSLKMPIEIYQGNMLDINNLIVSVEEGAKTSFPLSESFVETCDIRMDRFKFKQVDVNCKNQVIKGCCEADTDVCYMQVVQSTVKSDRKYQKSVSIRTMDFLPVVQIISFLPVNVQLQLKNDREQTKFHLVTPGNTENILEINPKEDNFTVSVKYVSEDGGEWVGSVNCNRKKKEPSALFLKSDTGPDLRFEIALDRLHHSLELHIYSVVWIVNKTKIDLNFKIDSRKYLLNATDENKAHLISFSNIKKAKGHLCIFESEWSEAFSLSAVGDESFVMCSTSEGVSYAIYISIQMSYTGLTNIITLSARYLIANHAGLDLMFAEVINESSSVEELSWISLPTMMCSPVWLHSPDAMLLLKEKDSAYVGPPIPLNCDNKIAKRLSNSQTVCVDVNRLGDQFIVNVTPYEEGCIPLRVDNYCSHSVFLKQREVDKLAAVTEFLPKTSQYFNWSQFNKPHQVIAMLLNPDCRERNVNISMTGWGHMNLEQNDKQDGVSTKTKCCSCTWCCFPSLCRGGHDEEDGQHLLSPSPPPLVADQIVYWVSYLEGMQRVLAFTPNHADAKKLRSSGDVEKVTMEIFLSLKGVGLSLVNSLPREICYAALTGGTSLWEVETKENVWKSLDIDTSTFLEDSWKNSAANARFENKIEVNLKEMIMKKPYHGRLKRSCDPALWVQYSQSENNTSVYVKLHRLQVDSQQYDVIYPSVLYPAPLPPRVVKRNGVKPLLELAIVFSSSHDVKIIKYLKFLLQEVNLKIDRSIITGVMSLMQNSSIALSGHTQFLQDNAFVKESVEESLRMVLESKSSQMLISYFHLSPVKIHLSFSMDDELNESSKSSSNDELLQWFISTIGIQFTDISDAVIKLGYFERKNTFITQDMLFADATKHYLLQAVKQFHVLVLGLDVLGNPYGLISEYGQGVKDLFYEPYLGSVAGPHQFAEGLAYGIKSLLGHTIGGTAGAASLITEQLGQVVAAMSFDSEYKRRRRQEMSSDPSGIGEGLAIGGKQFVLGLVFGISGLVTKPIQGARKSGIEGFFKGVGKGVLGLLVKPTGGVIDLLTSSLDGVRRFAEQGGEDIVCRIRLPRVTYPNKPVAVYNNERSYGYGLLRSLSAKQKIDGQYKDHVAIPTEHPTIVLFTTEMLIEATQSQFFSEWQVEWSTYYKSIESIEKRDNSVRFNLKLTSERKDKISISHSVFHEISCGKPLACRLLQEKALSCFNTAKISI